MKLITTSWDDGHPLDFKLAELLDKYNLKGTFYIPKANEEHDVINEKEVEQLSKHFEIGGHTMSHVRLAKLSNQQLHYEINGCYSWLKNIVNINPVSFCFPGGVYNRHIMEHALKAGFKVLRTTELLSVVPLKNSMMPTTIQLYEHERSTYFKHLIKRRKISSLVTWLKSFGEVKLGRMVEYYLMQVGKKGGCLHIWGHSWEIEEHNLWEKLEIVLKEISNLRDFSYRTNADIVEDGK